MGDGDRDARRDGRVIDALWETCGVGFWQVDARGHTVYLNPAMCRMLELDSPAAIGGELFHQFFSAESRKRMEAEHAKRAGGISSTYEAELIGRRGGRRNVVVSGSPVTDAAGTLAGLVGSFTDITDHKRAELALRDSENKLRSLFAASVDAIGVSRNGIHQMVNPAYVRMFGYQSESELAGKPILDLIAPAEQERVAGHVRLRSKGQSDVKHYLTRGRRRDGQEFPLEVHVSSYEQDGAFQTVVILRDITERLHLEDQLRQSQKMDALGRLAGGVAHDFNNLLTVIMSCADLVLSELPAGSESADNLQLIRTTGERAATFTRQLLALSRRQVVAPAVIDLNLVVQEMGAMLRRLIGPHIVLTVESDPALSPVRVDASQIQQVIMNLSVNARDAMPAGGRLNISARNVFLDEIFTRPLLGVTAGPFVCLSVADTGQGMSKEVLERLFEPFFTTKPPGEGTGLGLSTVYGIVKQSGGHVSATSAVGEGSTFRVYLPAVDAPLAAGAVEPGIQAEGKTGTVLVVEDEPALLRLAAKALSREGYRVLAAANGFEALAAFSGAAGAVDLVVSDMLMPGMSGVELARRLDQLAQGIRILFVSGFAQEGAEILASRPGSAFLAKPFTMSQLTAQVRASMGAQPSASRG